MSGSGYASAFDELLTSGRRELDRMTGQDRDEGQGRAQTPAEPRTGHAISGTVAGHPFRMRVKSEKDGAA